jgi:hypothetical protein
LGQIRRTFGEPMRARQGLFQWLWTELTFGQTILIKGRDDLPAVDPAASPGDVSDRHRPPQRKDPDTPEPPDSRQSEGGRWQGKRQSGDSLEQERNAAGTHRRNLPIDLERAIEWVVREQGNNASIGYAIRRVANEATPEQTAAFLTVLLQILRNGPNDR